MLSKNSYSVALRGFRPAHDLGGGRGLEALFDEHVERRLHDRLAAARRRLGLVSSGCFDISPSHKNLVPIGTRTCYEWYPLVPNRAAASITRSAAAATATIRARRRHEDLPDCEIGADPVRAVLGAAGCPAARLGDRGRACAVARRQCLAGQAPRIVRARGRRIGAVRRCSAWRYWSRPTGSRRQRAVAVVRRARRRSAWSASLARRPWTSDYARAAYPDNAGTPQFFVINAAITALWGVLFLRHRGLPLFRRVALDHHRDRGRSAR